MAHLLYISIHFENLSQANIKEIVIPAQKMACLLYISVHFENVSQNKHHRGNCAKKEWFVFHMLPSYTWITIFLRENSGHFPEGHC